MSVISPAVLADGGGGDGGGGGACLVSGTQITTSDGSVCVENLSLGTMVLTASGESRPVRWLGHREIDCNRYKDPAVVWPICIKAGAFAEKQPSRDLWVSPLHCILVEGVLIQAEKLINGATIVQVPRAHVKYWHVELDSHDLLLTEGLATESYLDSGNRTDFINGGAYLEAFPQFEPKHWSDTCVPMAMEGPAVQRAKEALLARAPALGYEVTSDADLHLLVDGQRLEALKLSDSRFAFTVPAQAAAIELRSRSFVPAHMRPASNDGRSLGVCVNRLQLDGAEMPLEDDAVFAEGWHGLEGTDAAQRWRWSCGRAVLPPGVRLIVIDTFSKGGRYWVEPPAELAALTA